VVERPWEEHRLSPRPHHRWEQPAAHDATAEPPGREVGCVPPAGVTFLVILVLTLLLRPLPLLAVLNVVTPPPLSGDTGAQGAPLQAYGRRRRHPRLPRTFSSSSISPSRSARRRSGHRRRSSSRWPSS
jgi:hypothetical protein